MIQDCDRHFIGQWRFREWKFATLSQLFLSICTSCCSMVHLLWKSFISKSLNWFKDWASLRFWIHDSQLGSVISPTLSAFFVHNLEKQRNVKKWELIWEVFGYALTQCPIECKKLLNQMYHSKKMMANKMIYSFILAQHLTFCL